ncbi:ADPRibase-Mn [Aix galericulata]|nr:ADPRibase-Mn [Aix galericulata]
MEAAPRVSFGVVADIQYADEEDGCDFWGRRRRYYRHSLRLLRAAVEAWAAEQPPVAFVVQLGDCIDGVNARRGAAEGALERVLAALRRLPVPVHHAWGNHELYNFCRDRLASSGLNSRPATAPAAGPPAGPPGDCHAYHFSPAPHLRFVLLDGYDLSVLGRDPASPSHRESLRRLRERNPNENLNSPAGRSRRGGARGSGACPLAPTGSEPGRALGVCRRVPLAVVPLWGFLDGLMCRVSCGTGTEGTCCRACCGRVERRPSQPRQHAGRQVETLCVQYGKSPPQE